MNSPAQLMDRTLIDLLLEEQCRLTAVDEFSRQHDLHAFPLQQKYYRDLIPGRLPGNGEQYGFEVDLDNCSGCKACVVACHSLNGLDTGESWRKVGVIVGRSQKQPFQQTVTAACHHCVEPGCLEGCPVEAYEKDEATGIVRHLDDQCIGCQYCSWTCPYDVPQFSDRRGIVRKCDMCHGRLAEGEAPACVQACPNGAITISIVSKEEKRLSAQTEPLLPTSAPDSRLTIPTTRYISRKPLPRFMEWPEQDLTPEHAHYPLIVMLLLTQASTGILLFSALALRTGLASTGFTRLGVLLGVALGHLGLAASLFHLGRPLHAWRSFLGWRHSWLSREVISFGAFGGFTMILGYLALTAEPSALMVGAAAAIGLGSVFTSAMVYHATKREFWNLRATAARFYGSVFLLGAATTWFIAAFASSRSSAVYASVLILLTLLKLGAEATIFKHLDREENGALWRSAQLLSTKLRPATGLRILCALSGGILLPFITLANGPTAAVAIAGLLFCLAGEFLERWLFFTAVSPQRMPGNI